MAEYIEREAVYNTLKAKYCDECTNEKCQMCEYADIMFVLDNLPIADVQPIRRGRWDFQGYQLFKCTNCKEMFTQDQLEAMQNHKDCEECAFPNYCPNCGADMRETKKG